MSETTEYELTKTQRLDLVYYVGEMLAYGEGVEFIDDVREAADSLSPVYHYEIRREWLAMGCPEPTHFDGWDDPQFITEKTISDRMQLAIALSYIDFCERLFAQAETRRQALDIANAYLGAHGWNTWAPGGHVATNGTQHGKQEEVCTECQTHCHP